MSSIEIVTDSTCDIPTDLVEKWHIHVVPNYINFGTQSYLDEVEMSREQFYQELVSNPIHPTTASPPPGRFAELYQKLAQTSSGIISLHPARPTVCLAAVGPQRVGTRQEFDSLPCIGFRSVEHGAGLDSHQSRPGCPGRR